MCPTIFVGHIIFCIKILAIIIGILEIFMKLTHDQTIAYEAMISGSNTFITGSGGTGKSYVINKYIEYCNKNDKNIIVAAPTGIAALNINGATLHRIFGLPLSPIIDKPTYIPEVLKTADVILIDEISMCRIDIFDRVASLIINANKQREKYNKNRIQLIVCGDFFQLPPVITDNDRSILETFYNKNLGKGFAFQSWYWSQMNFITIQLNDVVRQTDNEFVHYLNMIRYGDSRAIPYFNNKSIKIPKAGSIILCGTNKTAKLNNLNKLNELKTPRKIYLAKETGELRESDKYTDSDLELREGARIITLINDTEDKFKNGSLGTILKLHNDYITVDIDDGGIVDIHKYTWEIKNYKLNNKKLKSEVVATFTQIPVKLAYAITIHKSQGQTYSKVILNPYCWDHGQLYVALSRIKSIDSLNLESQIQSRFLVVSDTVKYFYSQLMKGSI